MRVPVPAKHGVTIVVTTLAAATAALIPATSQSQQASPPPATADSASPAAIAAGRAVYHGAGNCFVCHGANLEGGVGPALTAHEWKDAKAGGYAAILGVITTGVPGTAMVSHPGGISDDDARRVAAYVWAVSHSKAKP
jgi:mono/diheme cytochrome c family protein